MLRVVFIIFVVSFTHNAQGNVPARGIKSAHQAYLAAISTQERRIIAYLEGNMQLLDEGAIVVAEAAQELGIGSVLLGRKISALKKMLPEEHFIHQIKREQQAVGGKYVSVYRFANAVTTDEERKIAEEKRIIAYFEENIQLLEENGIVVAQAPQELGLKNSKMLGLAISALKKKLPENHFIHQIATDSLNIDGKYINVYRFANAVTTEEKKIIAYFEENIQLLEEDIIVISEAAQDLGISSALLGRRISELKKRLPEDHFIHKLTSSQQTVDGKSVQAYHFFVDNVAMF